ncbi:MAG: flagellar FlbD family protein [Actinomycetes bacterium]
MITLTRLSGAAFALNPDLIERAEATPDTVITLVDGGKYVVAESIEEIVARVRTFRASVIAAAQQLDGSRGWASDDDDEFDAPPPVRPTGDAPRATVLPMPRREC